jgi:hypothetical protein
MKIKQVSVRHIRSYSPFNDYITDTSHKFTDELDSDSDGDDEWDHDDPSTVTADTYCVVPYWGWHTLQTEGSLWTIAKILQVYRKSDTNLPKDSVLLHRYGNEQNKTDSTQKPGWISKTNNKIRFIASPNKQYNIPLRNTIDQDNPTYKTDTTIFTDDILYHGFQLHDKRIPLDVQRRLANNKDIDDNIDCRL